MTKRQIADRIHEIGIVPVIRAESSSQALMAVEALAAGGVPLAEITMTVGGALDAIRESRRRHGKDVLTGAGTVTNLMSARTCVEAGAEFLVSPGFDCEILRFALERDVLFIPGVLTPTEIMSATNQGVEVVKIFPCGNFGGTAYIKALRNPFPQLKMIPTGGVNVSNAAEYLRAGAFALGAGSDLVDPVALKNSMPQKITALARQFLEAVSEVRGAAPVSTVSR